MVNLISLVGIVNGPKFRANGMLNFIAQPNTRIRRLYDALASGQIWCSNSDSNPSCAACQQKTACNARVFAAVPEFKKAEALETTMTALKNRLEMALLLSDDEEEDPNDPQTVYLKCLKKEALVFLLLSKGYYQLAFDEAASLLELAAPFGFEEITGRAKKIIRMEASMKCMMCE